MKAAVLLLALALAGCKTIPDQVLVPVEVPCRVDMPEKPVWATAALSKDADIFDQVRALLAERRQRIGYQILLEAAVSACSFSSGASTVRQ